MQKKKKNSTSSRLNESLEEVTFGEVDIWHGVRKSQNKIIGDGNRKKEVSQFLAFFFSCPDFT